MSKEIMIPKKKKSTLFPVSPVKNSFVQKIKVLQKQESKSPKKMETIQEMKKRRKEQVEMVLQECVINATILDIQKKTTKEGEFTVYFKCNLEFCNFG